MATGASLRRCPPAPRGRNDSEQEQQALGSLPASLLLPPAGADLPGSPSDSFYSRLNRAQATDCRGLLVALVR